LLRFNENQSMAKSGLLDQELLAMALVGYQAQKAKLDAAIEGIQAQLGQRTASSAAGPGIPRKRTMSAAGRKRIAAAQRKRWAAIKKADPKPAAPKRKLSAAGRKAIADAARKRWAAIRQSKHGVLTTT
jgi:hypothetical protein